MRQRLHGLRMWLDAHPVATMIAAGVMVSLSWPPYYIIPLGMIGIALFWREVLRTRHPFRDSYLWGMSFAITSYWWIFRDTLPGMIGLFVYPPLFTAAMGWALARTNAWGVRRWPQWAPMITGALAVPSWVGLEYYWTLGQFNFPWATTALPWTLWPATIQLAWLGSEWLVSLWTLTLAYLGWRTIVRFTHARPYAWAFATWLVLLVGPIAWGAWRVDTLREARLRYDGSSATIAILQGNSDIDSVYLPGAVPGVIRSYEQLYLAAAKTYPHVVIWPESALPTILRYHWDEWSAVVAMHVLGGVPSFIGTIDQSPPVSMRVLPDMYNACIVVRPDRVQSFGGHHYKERLVPFGERIPFDNYFPRLRKLDLGGGMFTEVASNELLEAGPVRAGLLICYESVFPYLSREKVNQHANLLVVITNDAWFGLPQRWQHLAHAQLRAVENNMWLARAANTGLSGMVAPWGEPIGIMPRDTIAWRDYTIPIDEPARTPAYYLGDAIGIAGLVVLALSIVTAIVLRLRHGRYDAWLVAVREQE